MPAMTGAKRQFMKKKRMKSIMTNELLKNFIGRKCLVMFYNTMGGEQVVVEEVCENRMKVTQKNGAQKILNIDYLYSVTEIPEKKDCKALEFILQKTAASGL